MQLQRGSSGLFWALMGMAVSVPGALGLEVLLRHTVLPPEFEQMRLLLQPLLTPIVWFSVPLAVVANIGAFFLQRWLQKRPRPRKSGRKWHLGQLEHLMVSASLAQGPAIIAAFGYLIGSQIRPAGITILISTVGVMLLWMALPAKRAAGDAAPASQRQRRRAALGSGSASLR